MKERKNIIYLTGFMGSGKTTLAPLIANVLGYEHTDLDAEIERQTGLPISEIFRIHGEPYFREIEQTHLIELSRHHNLVVALGGGTVAFGDNLSVIKNTGVLVYLKASPDTIIRRVKRKKNRPMLYDEHGVTLPEDALRERVARLLAARETFYLQADTTYEISDDTVPISVDRIIKTIRKLIEQ